MILICDVCICLLHAEGLLSDGQTQFWKLWSQILCGSNPLFSMCFKSTLFFPWNVFFSSRKSINLLLFPFQTTWFFHENPPKSCVSHHFLMKISHFPWFFGFPTQFPWFFPWFPMQFPWFRLAQTSHGSQAWQCPGRLGARRAERVLGLECGAGALLDTWVYMYI